MPSESSAGVSQGGLYQQNKKHFGIHHTAPGGFKATGRGRRLNDGGRRVANSSRNHSGQCAMDSGVFQGKGGLWQKNRKKETRSLKNALDFRKQKESRTAHLKAWRMDSQSESPVPKCDIGLFLLASAVPAVCRWGVGEKTLRAFQQQQQIPSHRCLVPKPHVTQPKLAFLI